MSFLKTFCAASSNDGIVKMSGLGNATIELLGCSACVSLSPKEQAYSLLITDLHENGDLIAATIGSPNCKRPFLIEIKKKDGLPYIDLEKPESKETFIPKPDRMIQLLDDGSIRVKVESEWFSTNQDDRDKGHRILPVSAGNIMVKYAYGLAEPKEIIDLAEEIQLQADAVEMLEVEKAKNAQLYRQIREQENQIDTLANELESRRYLMAASLGNIKEIETKAEAIKNNLRRFVVNCTETKLLLSFIVGEVKKAKEALQK